MKIDRNSSPSRLKAITIALGTVLASIWLNSCRTTQGFGQDLQKVGDKIENEAARHG